MESHHLSRIHPVLRLSQDIQNMLLAWMGMEKSSKWSEGLRFVQITKNKDYHETICQSPYQAMFGRGIKLGLSMSSLHNEAVNEIEAEEELDVLLHTVKNRRFEIARHESKNVDTGTPNPELVTFPPKKADGRQTNQ